MGIMLAVIVLSAGASFKSAFAAGSLTTSTLTSALYMPFGGKVVSTTNPAITCINTEGGPVTIIPVRPSMPPTPYATVIATKRHSHIVIKPGSWIIGLYNPIPDVATCINPATGAPVPVLPIVIYGVSK